MTGSAHDGLALIARDAAFYLAVVGYQFPGEQGHDGEWLTIAASASAGDRSWMFREPCLLASELVSLAAWLGAIAEGRDAGFDSRIDFTEPELAFECERNSDQSVRLVVELGFAAAPPGGPDPFRLVLDLTNDQLRQATASMVAAVPEVIARQAKRGQLL